MVEPTPKRARLSIEEVMMELDNDEQDGPMMLNSDDEFEDIACTEKKRDEWGAVDNSLDDPTDNTTDYECATVDGGIRLPSSSLPLDSGGNMLTTPLSIGTMSDSVITHRSPLPGDGGETFTSTSDAGITLPESTTVHGGLTSTQMPPTPPNNTDPFALPLSHYFSLPLSTLVSLFQSAMTLAPSSTSAGMQCSHVPQVQTQTSVPPRQPAVRHVQSTHTTPSATNSALLGTWSSTLTPVNIAPFVQLVGPTVPIPQSEVDVFGLFFTEEICAYIVEQTNMYAQEVLGEKYNEWEKVNIQELKAYFGFMILMGLVSLPAMDDYWRRDPLLHYSPIADRISRDRFRDIHRFLHFADNSVLLTRDNPSYDRLGKVRPILERLQERLTTVYQPHCENAIDEAMIPFQGRSSLKQYMPAKPVKRGIKVWCRADSHNGYMCEVQVYTGRSERAEGGLGRRVVLDLSQKLEGKHHHLYFDNFFSSVSLLDTLLQKGLYACGTARQNYRDFPGALKMKGKGKLEMESHGLRMRYMYMYL